MKILALDQANRCGLCVGETGKLPKTFLINMGPAGADTPKYLWEWGQKVKELINVYKPDLLAYERPFFSHKTASSGNRLIKMAGVIEIIAYANRVEMMQIDHGTWKKSFTGSGAFKKATVPYPPVEECKRRGIDVNDSHDRADAAGIWFHAAIKHDPNGMRELDAPLFAYK